MTKKYITPNGIGEKDENGIYVKVTPKPPAPVPQGLESDRGTSIDTLLGKGLYSLDLLMKNILEQISSHTYDRETIMNLKDAMSMLHELKKREQDLVDNLSDDDLEALANAPESKRSG